MSNVIRGRIPKLAPLLSQSGEGDDIPFDVTFKIFGNTNSSVEKQEIDVDDKDNMLDYG